MLTLKIDKKLGEKVRRLLIENDLYDKDYLIDRDDKHLYLPIKHVDEKILREILKVDFEIVERDLKKRKKEKSFRDVINEKYRDIVDKKLLALSYDVIGDLVILQISDEVREDIRKEIGELAYKLIPCKGVFRRKSEVKGEFRIREIEHLAGENRTLTIHKENNYRLYVDIAKVYFSPRLSGERKRIGESVGLNETVIDMFAGVGPFSIACRRARRVYAIDINPEAISLLKKNIELNKVKHKIIPILADANEVDLKGDRVIMNLPKYSYKFVDKALSMINKNGIIHYYTIGENFSEGIKVFEGKCNFEILNKKIVKSYSPKKYIMAFDIIVKD
ncbi:hypothetical protein J422_05988 [Methanocaldococcus villosus KIN24-T80]|uniref:tRNA (guanine(37)-N(1))-methyltransferase n=1 Tax=Methanocaldococcus villosus KIN24-T80 TaxID=1069083 RepID=N6VRK1_9EURY|nr:class I SAM-dependent methyltransferase family protein [Methanocaldococcus villosus]ENN95786.1 hypothetical protein J422_05988 [Methanocaldococcus villosus KIN24-T80]